jgi:hypothetical protein
MLIQLLRVTFYENRISHITYTNVQYCSQSYRFTENYDSDLLEEPRLLLKYLCELHFYQAYFIPMSSAMMLGFKYQLQLRWVKL